MCHAEDERIIGAYPPVKGALLGPARGKGDRQRGCRSFGCGPGLEGCAPAQHPHIKQEYTMNLIRHRMLTALGSATLLGLTIFGPGTALVSAQSQFQPLDLPCADGIGVLPLGQALPGGAPGQALAALRVEFAPGGSLGTHTHPGTLIVSVESGAFGFTMADEDKGSDAQNEMQIMRAETDSTPAAAEPVQAGTEYVLNPGDWLVEPPGMVHSARGTADEPTVVLVTGLVDPAQPFIQCTDDASNS